MVVNPTTIQLQSGRPLYYSRRFMYVFLLQLIFISVTYMYAISSVLKYTSSGITVVHLQSEKGLNKQKLLLMMLIYCKIQ